MFTLYYIRSRARKSFCERKKKIESKDEQTRNTSKINIDELFPRSLDFISLTEPVLLRTISRHVTMTDKNTVTECRGFLSALTNCIKLFFLEHVSD